MNVFLYDLLKKAKSAWSVIAILGALQLCGGYYRRDTEDDLEKLASALSGISKSDELIEKGWLWVIVGICWYPLCTSLMRSLKKSFTGEERNRIGLTASKKRDGGKPISLDPDASVVSPTALETTVPLPSVPNPEPLTGADKTVTDIVLSYSKRINDDNIFFAPYIPASKLANAIKTFARGVSESEALVLLDDTVFGSGKDGILITAKTVYLHEMLEHPQQRSFSEICSISIDEKKYVQINDVKMIKLICPAKPAMVCFIEMIREIANGVRAGQETCEVVNT